MKCPNCKSEMERGFLPGYGGRIVWATKWFFGKYRKLIAWCCPKCDKVELTTEPGKK